MNRSFPIKKINAQWHRHELIKKTAVHEAGHAASIYLGNKGKQLPPVFFRILINDWDNPCYSAPEHRTQPQFFAHVDGGRLIQSLPTSIDEATRLFSAAQRQAYECAFETDIINLLVGPLAEAKYVALRDNEIMNPRLIDLNALNYYGGSSDLKLVYDYLDCLTIDAVRKKKKLAELFMAAYQFINNKAYWSVITSLADHIMATGKNSIDCEEVMAFVDAKLS